MNVKENRAKDTDLEWYHLMREWVLDILRDYPTDSQESVIERVKSRFTSAYGDALNQARADQNDALRREQESEAKAKKEDEERERIPRFLASTKASLPPSFLSKVWFVLLVVFAVGLLCVDAWSLAIYFRFQVDSVGWALLYTSPVVVAPIAEVAFLRRKWVPERIRHRVEISQTILGIICLILFLRYSLQYGDSSYSLAEASSQETEESIQLKRQLFQTLSLLCLGSGILTAASEFIRTTSSKNPDFIQCEDLSEGLRASAANYRKAAEVAQGRIKVWEGREKEMIELAKSLSGKLRGVIQKGEIEVGVTLRDLYEKE